MNQPSLFDCAEKETRFNKYLADNPHVWQAFVKFTMEAICAGHKRLSAELVVNRIRWETLIREKSGEFKINNDLKPFFARKFMADYPEYQGFFELRRSKADAEIPLRS